MGKAEEYKVTFRIDKETTVRQLHEDACAYWGCSPHAFDLCKVSADDTAEPLNKDKGSEKLQKETVLDPFIEAHLHLINNLMITKFVAQEKRKKDKKQQEENTATALKDDSEKMLKSFRNGTGTATNEHPAEPFVEALKQWPGIYNVLKHRHRNHDRRSNIIKFRDIVLFGMILLLSTLGIRFRNSVNFYYINEGIRGQLVEGIDSETTAPGVNLVNFEQITRYEDLWNWLSGPFHYQIFSNHSSLRGFYTPIGYLRIRQQIAKTRNECIRIEMPFFVQQPCHFVQVENETQLRHKLIFKPGTFFNYTEGEGRMEWPDPTEWVPAHDYDQNLYGYMQSYYDGSGYMIEYSLNEDNITQAGETFLANLPDLAKTWISTNTRMIVVELTLANFNLRGYICASFLVEVSPGWGMKTSTTFLPQGGELVLG